MGDFRPYVAHLCSSSKLGCRGAERPSAAQRRGAPERRAAARGAPMRPRSGAERRAVRYCSGAEPRFAAPASHQRLDESQVMSSDMSQVKVRPTEGLLILA